MTHSAPRTAPADQRLDKALEDSFPASDPPSITRAPKLQGEPSPARAGKDAAQNEEAAQHKAAISDKLDEALEDSFPASDPPSITRAPTPEGEPADDTDADRQHLSDQLDEALEETFPASDTPALLQPGSS